MASVSHERTGANVEVFTSSLTESGYTAIISLDGCTFLKLDMTESALRSLYGMDEAEVNISTSAAFWRLLREAATIGGHDEIVERMRDIEELPPGELRAA